MRIFFNENGLYITFKHNCGISTRISLLIRRIKTPVAKKCNEFTDSAGVEQNYHVSVQRNAVRPAIFLPGFSPDEANEFNLFLVR